MTVRAWVLLALVIAVTIVVVAAPRPSADIPSGIPRLTETDQPRTGAPQQSGATTTSAVVTYPPPADVQSSGAPQPTGGIDAGYYCSDPPECGYVEPTPRPQRVTVHDGIRGEATWWNSFGGGYYVAIRPDLGTKGDSVIVCGGAPFHCRTAPAITTCACLGPNSNRLVDLSADLFREFAPLSQGIVKVTVQVVRNQP